ncbi:MAG TPA: hypothetical protein VF913_16900 [Xanthobacteraceae bacterium]
MTPFRISTRIVAVTALIGVAFDEGVSQTLNNQAPNTPIEIAKAIARTITASTLKAPGAQIAFESATSHENIVEVRFVANDPAVFSRLKSNADHIRSVKASYYCNESRIIYLKHGVVMREIIATSNNNDQIEFTFDVSTCDSLPKSKLADSKALAEFALTVAKAENEQLGKPSNSPFRLDAATAHQGVVDERFVVLDASSALSAQANYGNIKGILTGYLCGKYGNFISQGLVFHHFFVLPDGSPVIDYTIDRSKC